jgi:monoamine oxidase
MRRKADWDVIVVGAGMAGLAASEALGKTGMRVLLLEARERIGGRVYTCTDAVLPAPIELGAEFVHGRPEVTLRLMQQAGIPLLRVPEVHALWLEGQVSTIHFLETLRPFLCQLPPPEASDEPVAIFWQRVFTDKVPASTRALARILAESFEAADPKQLSLQALAAMWRFRDSETFDYPQFRPQGGYGRLARWLYRRLEASSTACMLQTRVVAVRWEPGHVLVEAVQLGQLRRFEARALVLTLPLPLLRGEGPAALQLEPPLPSTWNVALHQLGMGAAVRVTLYFREPFWEHKLPFRELSFIHAPDEPFTTIWQPAPVRLPVLMAWAGGPAAQRLADLSMEEIYAQALHTIGRLYGIPDLWRYLIAVRGYDWQRDPFAQGAYSFVRPGGLGARALLSRPVYDTLFLAGEATDEDEAATVAGALQSGYRAAAQVQRALQGRTLTTAA